jgi:hypothetical protein
MSSNRAFISKAWKNKKKIDNLISPLMFYIEKIDWSSQLLKCHMDTHTRNAFPWCSVMKKLIDMF